MHAQVPKTNQSFKQSECASKTMLDSLAGNITQADVSVLLRIHSTMVESRYNAEKALRSVRL